MADTKAAAGGADNPRDATRGGVNGPALPGQPPAGGKISPLGINTGVHDAALTGGNYEVLRARLAAGGQELARRADALNARRKALFGTTEPQLIATERVRTEHNCTPADIIGLD